MYKSGYVSIIGETNAGKSTLLNRIMGEKISIVSPKVQTTRTNIKGIYTDDEKQIIFVDTPGIHKKNSKLSKLMIENAIGSIKDANVIVYVVAANKKKLSQFDYDILEKLKKVKTPIICVLNKVDRVKKELLLEKIQELQTEVEFKSIIPISALTGDGVDIVLNEITKLLEEGPKYYPDDIYTDQTLRQMTEEIIRGKALKLLREEIPHGIYIETENFKQKQTKKGQHIYDIEVNIYTKKDTHKGIIIGKNGEMLKRIGTYARQDLETFLESKVNLKIWVKVRKNWLDNDSIIQKFK